MPTIKTVKQLSDTTPDTKNANKGTQRGRGMLEQSLRQHGAGRSILLDRNGKIIAGNKTADVAGDIGLDDLIVVQSDGTRLVAVQRTDLDLDTDPSAKALAIADNRVGEISLDWDASVLAELSEEYEGLLDGLFREDELDALLGTVVENPLDEWQGMPAFEQDKAGAARSITVHFASLDDIPTFATLLGQLVTTATRYIWFPPQPEIDLKAYIAHDES